MLYYSGHTRRIGSMQTPNRLTMLNDHELLFQRPAILPSNGIKNFITDLMVLQM